ncbi:endo-1,4-beta-xylanase 3 [Aplysia californica]|uniref:Endo-1,4-beta-xylanase 3 n=1 Tax=Aplysia californica TaxID=6500 RepID=A0ABM1A2G0_APLCA|nr:endo-1,4-beta-xylanase 3 [Aplysia californica]
MRSGKYRILSLPALCAIVALVLWNGSVARAAVELLKNPGFENGVTFWSHDGFSMITTTEQVHGGRVAVKCTGRTQSWMGPAQNIQISRGKQYMFKSYIRLIKDLPGKMYQKAVVKISFTLKDGSKNYFPVCTRAYLTAADGWTLLGGDFSPPNIDWTQASLYLEGLLPGTDYYFDDASLTEIPSNPNWEREANQRIENLRKQNLHVNVNLGSGFSQKDVTVELNHLKHLFPFGSEVRADLMVDPDYAQYQQVVYYMFNWATVEAYKWRYNRGNRTNPNYDVAVAATDALNRHGLKVRGHCMFWAVDGNNPDWTETLSSSALKNAVDDRIAFITSLTKHKLKQWDVNNELLHGHFFEEHTGNPRYTEHMFQAVHAADPYPKLFLNDYSVVSHGDMTQSFFTQIMRFKAANVGLGGIGVQSHLQDYVEPNVDVINARLDVLAKAGLPIFITELDQSASDEHTRANWLEKVLRLYYAHPGMHGIILWGFWDHNTDPHKSLVQGYGFKLNESGKRFLKLTKETWSTHVNRSLASGTSFNLRAFQGDYEAVVWYKGKPIKRTTFSLGKADKTVSISVSGNGNAIQLPKKIDPFSMNVQINPQTNRLHLRTLGQARSSSQNAHLTCTTRRSRLSAVGDDKAVDVACQGDEVLTSCSSYLQNNDWHRDGEQMIMSNGKPACRAIDGFRTTAGIQAVARCCSVRGLRCEYRTAGPSGTGMDDKVEVPCQGQEHPLGCAAFTYNLDSDGVLFTNNSCLAENDDPVTGVFSYAACCQGSNLQCRTVTSGPSALNKGAQATVKCPNGYVMTGCNVYAKYGRAAGAYIGSASSGGDTCYAVNGADKFGSEIGVKAQATCCRT